MKKPIILVSCLLAAAIAIAGDIPPAGDYTIHQGGTQTGTCQFQGDPVATKILWENEGEEDIFFLDTRTGTYKSFASNTELEFTDQGNGSYSFTQTAMMYNGPTPVPSPQPKPPVPIFRIVPIGGAPGPMIVTGN